MELQDCYKNNIVVQPFFDKAKACLPSLAYLPIQTAFLDQDKMFKCVAITHMKKYLKKAAIAEEDFKELISLLDLFSDPYQEFIEKNANRTWDDIKTNLLGGLL